MKSITRLGVISALFLLSVLTTGCGQQWVRDINVEAYDDGGPHARVTTVLDMGSIQLPNMWFPILNPKTGEAIGQISLGHSPTDPNLEAIGIDLDIGELANITGCPGGAFLPNGQDLPLSLADRESLVCLPVAGAGIRIYVKLNLSADQALIGVAVPVKPMDALGKNLAPSSWFSTFLIRNEIPGTFGLFMGPQVGQNGLALFFELNSLLEKLGPIQVGKSAVQTLALADSPAPKERFTFKNVKPNSKGQMKIYNYMGNLGRQQAILNVH